MNKLKYTNLQYEFDRFGNVQNLMKIFTFSELVKKHHELNGNKACGIDETTKKIYAENLMNNLLNLENRIKTHSYFPQKVKRCFIPKSNGKLRALGIPAYEDKIVQGIMADILLSIYEPIFYDCSHGYRLGRNCHSALRSFNSIIKEGNTKFIVEADIKGFFDNINHEKLLNLLNIIVQDKYFCMYIDRFLKCGYIYNNSEQQTLLGTPQGGLISPVLGNIYLHYVLDDWFEATIKQYCKHASLIRYCDDFIACFSCEKDARCFYSAVQSRLSQCSLQIEPNKTRILSIDSPLNFLGFEISIDANNTVSFHTGKKKNREKKDYIDKVFSTNTNLPNTELINMLNYKLGGWYSYYRC